MLRQHSTRCNQSSIVMEVSNSDAALTELNLASQTPSPALKGAVQTFPLSPGKAKDPATASCSPSLCRAHHRGGSSSFLLLARQDARLEASFESVLGAAGTGPGQGASPASSLQSELQSLTLGSRSQSLSAGRAASGAAGQPASLQSALPHSPHSTSHVPGGFEQAT